MKGVFSSILFCFLFIGGAFAQSTDDILGVWKSIDFDDNIAKAHIEIYKKNGKYHGKIIKLLQRPADTICPSCPGEKKNQLLVGMTIVMDLEFDDDYWSDGEILDPEDGKTYGCNIYLESPDKIRLRGYLGIPAIGKSQYWYRVK